MLKPPDFHDTRLSAAGRADAALMPAADRQRLIEMLLVRYPRHRAMTKFIARFHRPVDNGTHDRGHIGALLGATRSGKSWVLRDYVSAFPSTEGNGIVRRPVIYIELMNDMAAHDVACKSFTSLGYASIPKVKTDALMAMVIDALPDHSVELIVLDDVDNALHSHRTGYAGKILAFIKGILDKDCCNVLCAGRPELYTSLAAAGQIKGRGGLQQSVLEPYRWQVQDEREQVRLLLDEIDERLPFAEKSGLANPDLAAHLYAVSGGVVGEIMNYIRPAAFEAINDRAGRIERDHLIHVAKMLMAPGAKFVPFRDAVDPQRLIDEATERETQAREDKAARRLKRPFSKQRKGGWG